MKWENMKWENIKVENLKDEGLEFLSKLPQDINDEIKGLSTLTKDNIDPNKSLSLFIYIERGLISIENIYQYIKNQFIESIKDKIKDTKVWLDSDNYGTIEVYTNEPTIEEVIDKDYNTDEVFIHLYKIYIRTNIYKEKL